MCQKSYSGQESSNMTVQQAIEKHIIECRNRIANIESFMASNPDADITECGNNIATLRMAAAALEIIRDLQDCNMVMGELKEHAKFKRECIQKGFTLQSVLEAREKQIAKKPTYLPLKEGITTTNYECPICGCRRLGHGTNLDKCYCPECGQKLDWSKNRTEQEPMITFRKTAAVGRSEYLPKPLAIYLGFSSHDCESRYRCPRCNNIFGSWSVFNNKENENGTNLYCPSCKTELDGLK